MDHDDGIDGEEIVISVLLVTIAGLLFVWLDHWLYGS
jgi:hypothetical protein